ncbi:hypothetical protein BASA81_002746 [Batrachochytrium salamandrivorans]|nr:hypothetical protein BASA81_002746 [Batrachochytrium salamandrivorans]
MVTATTKPLPPVTVSRGTKVMALVFTFFGMSLLVALGSAVAFRHRDLFSVQTRQLQSVWDSLFPGPRSQDVTKSCVDNNDQCSVWASSGECEENPKYMLSNCRKSCGICPVPEVTVTAVATEKEEDDDDDNEEVAYDDGELAEEDQGEDEEDDEDDYTNAPRVIPADTCVDESKECDAWAKRGECDVNPGYMLDKCKKSCQVCNSDVTSTSCLDHHTNCEFWAKSGECKTNPGYMLQNCQKSCQRCRTTSTTKEEKTMACKDRHNPVTCRQRQQAGECERNPGWMIVMCAATCNACDLLPQKSRCRPEVFNDTNYRYENALEFPGDLNRKFENILKTYTNTTVLSRDPYVLQLHNFVSEVERATLLGLTLPNIRRSTDQGHVSVEGIQEQIVSTGRTSENAWCLHDCMANPIVSNLTDRISKLLAVPTSHFESYQVLQYKIGQYYNVHHDSGEEDILDMSGPRIFTFFIYFTDVEEGGETHFDKLGLKVKPEVGSAILWPSVLDSNPKKIDKRTTHAALPVLKGTKHAANAWIHMRDFETANLWGCTGSFDE